MQMRKVSTRFLLLVCVLIVCNIIPLIYYNSGNLTEEDSRCREMLLYRNTVIEEQNSEITRLQRQINFLSNSPNASPVFNKPASRSNLTHIYMITPTYRRWTQKADLTRLAQTLMHVPNLHWIVVEDADGKTDLVANFLRRHSVALRSAHLNVRTAERLRLKRDEPVWRQNRGVEQRNLALEWLRAQADRGALPDRGRGVVYFGDDDNTYDVELFEEMRDTKMVSVWLVGISGELRFEGPTCRNGKVTGWYTAWGFERTFQLDMAGFAVNLHLLLSNRVAEIDPNARRGYLENSLLEKLVSLDQLEPKGQDCTKVLVWHTRTVSPKMKHEKKLISKGKPSDPNIET